ncbi:hypothetical protein [Paenibacillus sp. UNC451MF]|uniref:hypothetical protein n=1 Tax=Paenibacillus sp. UNC451MF TaxID=1449063 RepID=UPI00048C3902|nr:hypothetical protein [Paenibacillus sp. UNC451MF]
MNRYAIFSSDNQKQAEIDMDQDVIILTLRTTGESVPHFTGCLDEMLSCSFGRPWRTNCSKLMEPQITADSASIRIQGRLEALNVTLELDFDKHDALKIKVLWANPSEQILHETAVGLLLSLPRRNTEMITIPHMIYNNNPSSDPERVVPKLGVGPGKGFICEEHRLPIPCVNVEWSMESGNRQFLSLYSMPAYVEAFDGTVHYGSLGVIQEDNRLVIAAMSGVLMFNGDKDIVYVAKSKTQPYDGGYLDFTPGFVLKKEYVLDWGDVIHPGQAFREIVHTGLKLFEPMGTMPLTAEQIIELKTHALDDRWRTNEQGAAGYIKFTDSNSFGNVSKHPLHYMYGWTGQCLKLAWCDAHLGFDLGEEERVNRCVQAVDFYVQASRTNVPGVRHSSYRLLEGEWDDFSWNKQPVISSRAYGETAADLAEIVLLFKEKGREVPADWLNTLQEMADFIVSGTLPSGIVPAAWQMDGSPVDEMVTAAGLPCLISITKMYRLTGDYRLLAAAEMMMQRYYEMHVETFERPFARSTLDAKCEDKEAGMYFFLAVYELWVVTRKQHYEDWAEVSADWLLTYVYLWNPAYDKGSKFREAGFNAIGWPGVSVQNHHLDVFFPTYEFYRFGQLSGKSMYERMGRMTFGAMGQGICTKPGDWNFTVVGEQGEGFFQTHWNHRGHSNKWNPSWVIALVLQNALRFRDAGE